MRTPTLNHYFEPKIMRIIIEIIRYVIYSMQNFITFLQGFLLPLYVIMPSLQLATDDITKQLFAQNTSSDDFNIKNAPFGVLTIINI